MFIIMGGLVGIYTDNLELPLSKVFDFSYTAKLGDSQIFGEKVMSQEKSVRDVSARALEDTYCLAI